MATASHIRPRRRQVRAVIRHSVAKPSLTAGLLRAAGTRTARTALVVIGTTGLAALAVAMIGPRRLERDVIRPLRGAIEPQAEKLWADSAGLREQIAGLFQNATPTGRQKLVRNFQSWIGHFHAT
jgi:hypothetical protein